MADKRDTRRIKKRISIRFGISEAIRVAFTDDISMIGMFVKIPHVIPPNTRIKIEIVLPEGSRVELEARVMWVKFVVTAQSDHLGMRETGK